MLFYFRYWINFERLSATLRFF